MKILKDKCIPKSKTTVLPIDDLLKKTFKKLAKLKKTKSGITGIPTGFAQLDKMTSGMQNGELLVLASRPSVGKTALATDIAINAWREGYSFMFFSLGMSSEQLVLRMLSSQSKIPHKKIRNCTVTNDEWGTLTDVSAALAEASVLSGFTPCITIDDSDVLNVIDIRLKVKKLISKKKADFIVIDCLQFLSSPEEHENRTIEVSYISRSLRNLAKELNIPILAVSQLSRTLETRSDKTPLLHDLSGSGSIENDADIVLFLYRDFIYNRNTDQPDLAEIIVGKNRNGPTGIVYARFCGDIVTFEDIDIEYGDE